MSNSPKSVFNSSKIFIDFDIRQPSFLSNPAPVDKSKQADKILNQGYEEDLKSVSTDASKSYLSSHVSFCESESEDEQVIVVHCPKLYKSSELSLDDIDVLSKQIGLTDQEMNDLTQLIPNNITLHEYLESLEVPVKVVYDAVNKLEFERSIQHKHIAGTKIHHTTHHRSRKRDIFNPNIVVEKQASWSELLIDLFYVSAFFQLNHNFKFKYPMSYFNYYVLISVIWQHWLMISIFATGFENDDLVNRIFRFLQLIVIGLFTVLQKDAFSNVDVLHAMALVFTFSRLLQFTQYLIFLVVQNKRTRIVSVLPFCISHFINMIIWMMQFIPSNLDGVAQGLMLLTLVIDWSIFLIFKGNQIPHTGFYLAERFAVITSIILGDLLLGSTITVTEIDWATIHIVYLLLCFSIAFSIWWLYFDDFGASALSKKGYILLIWIFAHYVFHISLMYCGKSLEMLLKATYNNQFLVSDDLMKQTFVSFGILLIINSCIKLVNKIAGDTNRDTILFSRLVMGCITLFFVWLPISTIGGVLTTVTVLMAIQVVIDVFSLFFRR
eukprot:NODE_400_length_9358_cov_0.345070.p1 type:complete len:552 gc:universal NODE_400_length_9358_cov_0.345070:2482-827(-)